MTGKVAIRRTVESKSGETIKTVNSLSGGEADGTLGRVPAIDDVAHAEVLVDRMSVRADGQVSDSVAVQVTGETGDLTKPAVKTKSCRAVQIGTDQNCHRRKVPGLSGIPAEKYV